MNENREFQPEAVRVAHQLRSSIIDGKRVGGSKLVEREIAAELGVSRLPVREALKILIAEGLVTPRPRTWAVVREIKASDIADVIEVRAALELMTFKLAAQRHTREALAQLRSTLDEELSFADNLDPISARKAGAKFHDQVNAMAGNQLLNELHAAIGGRIKWLMGHHEERADMAAEHESLFQAIASRDLGALEILVPQHLESSKTNALNRWRKLNSHQISS